MIFGAHVVIYSEDAEADRAFVRDVLGFDGVDAGQGWLLFALPPAELAFHPAEHQAAELLLMCDDLEAEMARLDERGAAIGPVDEARWGRVTRIGLPSGGTIGLYQPNHPSPLSPWD
jgi:catechol 2,3-dioxygenase-like lactoylglutathione lyase family enzyme